MYSGLTDQRCEWNVNWTKYTYLLHRETNDSLRKGRETSEIICDKFHCI